MENVETRLAATARLHGADAADAYVRWLDSHPDVSPAEASTQWRQLRLAIAKTIRGRLEGLVGEDVVERVIGEAVASFTAAALAQLGAGHPGHGPGGTA